MSIAREKITVLVVDDDSDVRELLRVALQPEDVEIVGYAGTGEDAVRLVGELHPDVVVMDLMMPGMDGAEATRRIQENDPETYVLGFTAGGAEATERLSRAGAIGVFDKTTIVDLLETVENLDIERRRTQRPRRLY